MDQTALTRIHDSFNAQALLRTFEAKLLSVEEGRVQIEAPILPLALQQQGFGHAGLTFSVGDSAAGYAALTTLPMTSEVVTSEIKINLLAPAIGERIVATGKVVKSGKRLCVVTSEVHAEKNGDQTLIAVLQGTMVPVPL